MKISNFKRLIKEDVPKENQALMDKIAYSINPFADEVIKALNNNLSIEDNFNQNIRTITTQVDSSGKPSQILQFKTNLNGLCKGIQIIKADNLTNPTIYPTGHPFFSFTESNGIITVNNITGLPANNNFQIRVILHQ